MKTLSKIIMAVVLMASFVSYTYGQASKTGNSSKSSYGGHEYVDLGLPSGTLWATCNVGANSPEEIGAYFAWGETKPQANKAYSEESYSYKYCAKTTGMDELCELEKITKHYGDGRHLLPEYDAATATWGSGWRMPTNTELKELTDNCTATWTTKNGVKGCLFTASNGKSIFLPAAGVRWLGSTDYTDCCYYWASDYDWYGAMYLWLDDCYDYHIPEYVGMTVRPVRSASQK